MKPRTRLIALLGLAVALWWARSLLLPAGGSGGGNETVGGRPRVAGLATRTSPLASLPTAADVCTTAAALPLRELLDAGSHADPFTPPQVVVVQAAPVVQAFVGPPPPPPPRPPPPPPRLPYRLLGVLNEKGQPGVVYLALGDKLIQAQAGDTLEGGYRLENVGPRELIFLNLQQNLTVRMAVDGEPS